MKPFDAVVVPLRSQLGPSIGSAITDANVVLGYASPRHLYYMAKREIFDWHPLVARILQAVGTFPVERGKRDAVALQIAVETVRSGKTVKI